MKSFTQLQIEYSWKPIPGCAGRFILKSANKQLTPWLLTGCQSAFHLFHPVAAPDPVYVALIPGGGIISYVKNDGTYLHTLNTEQGFTRKLEMLGITASQLKLPEL